MLNHKKEIDNLETTVNRNKLKDTGKNINTIVSTLIEKGIKVKLIN